MNGATACRGDYLWLVSGEVPRLVDAIVMHHQIARLVVTSFDSGRFIPGPGELASGWTFVNGIAVSPPLSDKLSLPTAGFDEWYVFDELPGPTFIPEVFVNYVPFPLEIPPIPSTGSLDETDQWRSDAVDRFWRQLESFRPISYVARADSDVVVTRRERFMQDVSPSS
jgi:hypothetical protein